MKTVEFQATVRGTPFGNDKIRVPGRGVEVAPGLLVGRSFGFDGNQQNGPEWRFHHVASGLGFGYFRTRAAALRAAKKVARLADWTKSATAIRRAKARILKRLDAAIESEGGSR